MRSPSVAMRQILEACDVAEARRAWGELRPGFPQPETDEEIVVALHYARTLAQSVAFRLRAYSHAWLRERGLPSGLPDRLRPRAQRIYPVVVDAVGIAVSGATSAGPRRDLALAIRDAMSEAVAGAYADGRRDPPFVRARMSEARARVLRL